MTKGTKSFLDFVFFVSFVYFVFDPQKPGVKLNCHIHPRPGRSSGRT